MTHLWSTKINKKWGKGLVVKNPKWPSTKGGQTPGKLDSDSTPTPSKYEIFSSDSTPTPQKISEFRFQLLLQIRLHVCFYYNFWHKKHLIKQCLFDKNEEKAGV